MKGLGIVITQQRGGPTLYNSRTTQRKIFKLIPWVRLLQILYEFWSEFCRGQRSSFQTQKVSVLSYLYLL